jgi:hypothetical protein
MHDQLQLSATILTRWQHLVASNKALNFLHWAMCVVMNRRIAMAIETASYLGVFVDCCLFACCPGGRWRDMEQVAARCRRPVASEVALDMLHWGMLSVLLWRTAVTIKMGPGHAASGNAICIPPAHRRGHQNGWWTRCICSSLSILSLTITIAKDHVMIH